jgi:hypothetical protein
MSYAVVLAALLNLLLPAAATAQAHSDWTTYRNPTLGFGLRYPAAMLELKLKMHPLGEESELVAILFLIARGVDPQRTYLGHVTALQVAVRQAGRKGNVMYPPTAIDFYRRVAREGSFRDLKVGGRTAGKYISCGRAACHWGVVVPGSRELMISSDDPDEDSKDGPDDTRYPLQSIIDSVVFERTFPK